MYRFQTNEAAKYGPNVKCLITYKRQGNCKKMRVASGEQFSLAAGDMLKVTRHPMFCVSRPWPEFGWVSRIQSAPDDFVPGTVPLMPKTLVMRCP